VSIHSIPHDLSEKEAREVIDRAVKTYTKTFAAYSPEASWASDKELVVRFRAYGLTINARLMLTDSYISIDIELPAMLRSFEAQAVKIIDEEVQRWIKVAKSKQQ
jgi:ABC-type uncharacterized transport system auxiliary subunit